MSNYTARSLMGKTRSITALGAHRTVRPKNALDMLESLGFVVELRGDRTEIEFSYAPYRRNHYGFVNRIIAKLNPLGAAEHSDAPCCLAVLRGARLAPGEEFRAAACSATARPDGSTQLTLL